MNIGIVTAAWNGYGRFIYQWLEAIDHLKTKPTAITIALGENHGLTDAMEYEIAQDFSHLKYKLIRTDAPALMGPMRNAAVEPTDTEWIMYLSADDVILPDAIDIFKRYEADADYICIMWQSAMMWTKDPVITIHKPKTPQEMAEFHNGHGFIVGHSPFRKRLWRLHPYAEHDYPNAPFVVDAMEAGARFVKTDKPCTMYLRRLDSHAARLGRRRQTFDREEKLQALKWKWDMEQRIRDYYGKK